MIGLQRKFTIKRNTIKKVVKQKKKPQSNATSSSITRKTMAEQLQINIITTVGIDTSNADRLRAPIDTESGTRKRKRRATKSLTLKSAPPIPTAPKDPIERKKRWAFHQIKTHIGLVDVPVVLISIVLAVCGIFAVYSSTLSYGSDRFVLVQGAGLILGILSAMIISVIDYRSLASAYRYIIILNVLILLGTYLLGTGVTTDTNTNWIDLGFIKIQPSEFSKLLFIYSFAAHLAAVRDRMHKFTTVLTLALHAALIFGLVLLQTDLGSLTIFLLIFICMCFAAGISIWYYVLGGTLLVGVSPFIWSKLNYYQQNRIMICFDKSIDPDGVGIRYQQKVSQTAIGNGGIFGNGFTEGNITQIASGNDNHLPAKHTDMIYSTISEEFGMVGSVLILVLMFFLVFRIFKIGMHCPNYIGRYICVGVGSMLMIQVIENVGMCLGLMPVIGITFPFLSYGGSSILSCMMAMGMVLSVSAHREKTFF